MVDVTHDRHDRGALGQIVVGVVEDDLSGGLVLGVDDLDLFAELDAEQLDRVVGERLRLGLHLTQLHQLLDDLRDANVEVLGNVLDGRPGVDPDQVGRATAVCAGRDSASSS